MIELHTSFKLKLADVCLTKNNQHTTLSISCQFKCRPQLATCLDAEAICLFPILISQQQRTH